MSKNKFMYMALGAAFGGLAGYLITDLIIYKILEKSFDDELFTLSPEERNTLLAEINKSEEDKRVTDYTKHSKPSLTELVKPYSSEDAPYIISLEEWETEKHPLDREETVMYYDSDGTFADEDEQIISDPQNKFGPNIFLHFGERSEDQDVVYVYNPGLNTKYEVIRKYSSYRVEVLGEPEPPKKAAVKRRAKAAKVEPEDVVTKESDESDG